MSDPTMSTVSATRNKLAPLAPPPQECFKRMSLGLCPFSGEKKCSSLRPHKNRRNAVSDDADAIDVNDVNDVSNEVFL
jgi:hypothetical protein